MVATLKTSVVQEPSSGTANLTLDASGGVTVGQNLTVTGTTTFTGGSTFTGNATAAAFIPSGSTIPTNGLYRPAANTVGLATNSTNALYIDSSQNVGIGTSSPAYKLDVNSNANVNGTVVMTSPYTMRNKIINGAMVIDQRNAGAQITIGTTNSYAVDRFQINKDTVSGTMYAQQSTTAPSGFSNSLLFTANTAWTPASGDLALSQQKIEGFNSSDLGFGTASASIVTLSFWVRSSITGTYCAGLINSANNRSYVATYTINAANTFEYKTITIAGDTSGTWIGATNGIGVRVNFDLGSGSTYNTTAGAWASGLYTRTSGSVNWTQTTGATFYITGVQLERGTVATPFEYRNYQQELAMCQRYYESSLPAGTAPSNGANTTTMVSNAVNITPVAAWGGTTPQNTNIRFAVPKRATPTMTTYGNSQGYWGYLTSGATLPTNQNTYTFSSSVNAQSADTNSFYVNQQVSQSILWGVAGNWAASAEL